MLSLHHLYIGIDIKKVLETLESEYGLDFNELAKSKKKNKSEHISSVTGMIRIGSLAKSKNIKW